MSICLNLNNSDQIPKAFYFMHKILCIFMHKKITNVFVSRFLNCYIKQCFNNNLWVYLFMSFSYFLGIHVYSYNFWVKGYMCLKLSYIVTKWLSQLNSLCPTSHPGAGSVLGAQLSQVLRTSTVSIQAEEENANSDH